MKRRILGEKRKKKNKKREGKTQRTKKKKKWVSRNREEIVSSFAFF